MKNVVLIIDDEIAATLASGLKQCAGSEELEFRTATDGAQGLSLAETLNPDLILLDIGLPVIDGFKVLSELQRRQVRTRIIMMSGYKTDVTTAIECVKAGACDYILKGQVLPHFILERIRRALIVESTLNIRISELPASAKGLIEEASRLQKDYERLKQENELLAAANETLSRTMSNERRHIVLEIVQRILYVLLACGSVFLLSRFNVIQVTLALPLVFLFLMVILLIPADKIQNFSASISKVIRAQINMQQPVKRTPDDELPK